MERFTNSIKKSLETKNWFAALFMALALPDICGALEDPNRGVGERYKDWFDRYLKPKYYSTGSTNFSAEDCYMLRCSCLHQGLSGRVGNDRIHFTIPDPSGRLNIHKNNLNGILQLSIDVFCFDICIATSSWAEKVNSDTNIQQRIKELIKIYDLDAKELPIVKYK